MNILLIGGYRFVGRAIIEAAKARGHRVTAFNRALNWPAQIDDVELIQGDRHRDLERLADRRWDVAIDTNAYTPANVSALTSTLANQIDHYTLISSLSVYAWPVPPGTRENAPVSLLEADADPEADIPETYGARKALCEGAASTVMPGRTLALRAGMIVGPHDYLDRFTYWLERCAGASDFIAPGDPGRQLQLIDALDLATWTLTLAEERYSGTLHATGPTNGIMRMKDLIDACSVATGGLSRPIWVDDSRLEQLGIAPDSDLPYWIPAAENGLFEIDLSAARARGLVTRPLLETARRTYAWVQTRKNGSRNRGLSLESEAELIAKLRAP
ncbi:MAG: epimerase [Candidatus Eremiobacteraeota bacterium]|nr:epimerase [Candidatus Eremiobacteraeota bacterium]